MPASGPDDIRIRAQVRARQARNAKANAKPKPPPKVTIPSVNPKDYKYDQSGGDSVRNAFANASKNSKPKPSSSGKDLTKAAQGRLKTKYSRDKAFKQAVEGQKSGRHLSAHEKHLLHAARGNK